MSKRSTIITNLITLIDDGGLSLAQPTLASAKDISMEDMDSTLFPLCHILDNLQSLIYLPFNQVEATMEPTLRFFWTERTYAQLEAFDVQVRNLFVAGTSLGATDSVFLRQTGYVVDPITNFYDVRVELEIKYRYTHGSP